MRVRLPGFGVLYSALGLRGFRVFRVRAFRVCGASGFLASTLLGVRGI